MKTMGVGIVGCGEIAIQRHIPSWKRNRKARVVAVADIDENKVMNVARSFHIPRYYTDYKEMIKKEEDLEVIDVCTPVKYHREQVIEACRNGKHVVVEKPMAASVGDCQEMIKEAKKNDVQLTICHTMRMYPTLEHIERCITKAGIGDIQLLHIITPYEELQPWVLSQGGALWELGIHRIYLILYLLGDVKEVEVKTYNSKDPQGNMQIVFYTERGIGIVHLLKAKGEEQATIYGSNGRVRLLPLVFNTAIIEKYRKKNWLDIFKNELTSILKMAKGITKRGFEHLIKRVKTTPHYILLDQFIDAINGSREVPVPPEEGEKSIAILMKIEKLIKEDVR